jgi:hypothetical protein
MSFATASCDLWQNEQRSTSSEPVLVLTDKNSFTAHASKLEISRPAFPVRSIREESCYPLKAHRYRPSVSLFLNPSELVHCETY